MVRQIVVTSTDGSVSPLAVSRTSGRGEPQRPHWRQMCMAFRSTSAVLAALIAVTACSSVDSGGDHVALSSPWSTAPSPSLTSPATTPASLPGPDAVPATATWSCVGEESTHTTGQLVIDIVPAEDCSAAERDGPRDEYRRGGMWKRRHGQPW